MKWRGAVWSVSVFTRRPVFVLNLGSHDRQCEAVAGGKHSRRYSGATLPPKSWGRSHLGHTVSHIPYHLIPLKFRSRTNVNLDEHHVKRGTALWPRAWQRRDAEPRWASAELCQHGGTGLLQAYIFIPILNFKQIDPRPWAWRKFGKKTRIWLFNYSFPASFRFPMTGTPPSFIVWKCSSSNTMPSSYTYITLFGTCTCVPRTTRSMKHL